MTNNGEPVARVIPLSDRSGDGVGFLPAHLARDVRIPDDFDDMGTNEITAAFGFTRESLLLDTHLLLWAAIGSPRLPAMPRAVSEDPADGVLQCGQRVRDGDRARPGAAVRRRFVQDGARVGAAHFRA